MPKAGEAILALFNKLGGNMNNVLGSRSNITFLGKGKNTEAFLDSDINVEAIGVLGKNKILEELESSIGYLTAGKLNDVQANKLLTNMQKIDEVFNPKQVANIVDLGTGTGNLDQKGLASLRGLTDETAEVGPEIRQFNEDFAARVEADNAARGVDPNSEIAASLRLEEKGKKLADSMSDAEIELRSNFPRASDEEIQSMLRLNIKNIDDLPPPGSRGGPDDIAAPFASAKDTMAELNKAVAIANVKGVGAPAKRATAREFLVEALKEDDTFATKLGSVIDAQDVKYITEGGGGIMGDPLVLVEKYFGPKILEMIPSGASNEEIIIFTKRVMNNVEDAAGLKPDNPRFDRFTARFIDEVQDFAKGGLAKILEV